MSEVWYVEGGEEIKVCSVLTNHGMTIDEMLELCEIDMDKFADEQGWDGWNYESLVIREEA